MTASDPTARFERALVRLIQNFNYLDLNVGLCLSHLLNPGKAEDSYPLLAKMTTEKRFSRLKKLFDEDGGLAVKEAQVDFSEWYQNAMKVRNIRNRYLHGCWELLPLRTQTPVSLRSPPWMKEKLGSSFHETMSIEELETVADEVGSAFNELMRLRKKYRV